LRRTWRKPKLQKTVILFTAGPGNLNRKGQQVSTPQDLGIIGYLWTQNLRRSNYYKTFKFQTSDDKPCMPQSWLTEISALKFLVELPDHQGGVIDSSGSNQVIKWHLKLSLDQVTKLYFQDIDDQSNLEEKTFIPPTYYL
jgi:hypothetical protein